MQPFDPARDLGVLLKTAVRGRFAELQTALRQHCPEFSGGH